MCRASGRTGLRAGSSPSVVSCQRAISARIASGISRATNRRTCERFGRSLTTVRKLRARSAPGAIEVDRIRHDFSPDLACRVRGEECDPGLDSASVTTSGSPRANRSSAPAERHSCPRGEAGGNFFGLKWRFLPAEHQPQHVQRDHDRALADVAATPRERERAGEGRS